MPRTRNGKSEEPPKKRSRTKRAPARTVKQQAAKEQRADKPPEVAPGKRLSMVEKLRLAERLVAARERPKPEPWSAIQKREGLPMRTLERIYHDHKDSMKKLTDSSGQPILAESLLLYTASIDKLAWEAEHGETSAARVGAVRTMLDAVKGRIELLAVMGRMPRNFRAMDELAALQRYVRRLAEIVERNALPVEVVQEFTMLADEIAPIIEGTAQPALPRAS